MDWHVLSVDQAVARLSGDAERGLSPAEAARRLAELGPNAIPVQGRRGPLRMFAAQFMDLMIAILLLAGLISAALGELQDAAMISVIVLLNAVVGAIQEYRAQRALDALRRMSAALARVVRDGELHTVPAEQLVTGDVIVIEAGDVVPADVRLVESRGCRVDEAPLTGESMPVDKSEAQLDEPAVALGNRINMVYKSTHVTRGQARGIVVATGLRTEIGRIAELMSRGHRTRTPLQRRLAQFGAKLALAVIAICVAVFGLGLLQGQPPLLMFLVAVSLAVAAVPEALPAVVTISLALGARRLSRKRALIRRLPAVETLGSVTFICSDKTGTLTENSMTAAVLATADERVAALPVDGAAQWQRLAEALALNHDVRREGEGRAGDPTEVALLAAVEQAGVALDELEKRLPRVAALAFDAERKRMSTLHGSNGGAVIFTKGAPEAVLARCDRALTAAGPVPLAREELGRQAHELAAQGYRVLAFAYRELADCPSELVAELEDSLVFIAFVGLEDPLRPEARQAVADCRSAGIVPVMITGDHPETALSIASQLGMANAATRVATGAELADLSPAELAERARDWRVYARVDPEQKIRIVSALQQAGEFVAMTGDGVNDAPALERADVGVAMGKKGTDVAREAADIVLLDDNFATIVAAVREGRRVYDNIRKFIKYTMTSNAGEIWTLLLAPLLGMPLPLLPIQILWINLVTDGLPGLALAAESAERDVMQRPPRAPAESVFAHGLWQHMLIVGLLIGGLSIAAQAIGLSGGESHAQTMVFTTLVLAQLFQAFAIRSERRTLKSLGLTSNPQLFWAVALTIVAQLLVIYLPPLNPLFHTQPLPLLDLLLCFGLGAVVLVVLEAKKMLDGRLEQSAGPV